MKEAVMETRKAESAGAAAIEAKETVTTKTVNAWLCACENPWETRLETKSRDLLEYLACLAADLKPVHAYKDRSGSLTTWEWAVAAPFYANTGDGWPYRIKLERSSENSRNGQQQWIKLSFDHMTVATTDEQLEKDGTNCDISPLLTWLIGETKETIQKVREGTYKEWTEQTFPKEDRFGLISRKALRDFVPSIREKIRDGLTEEDVQEFVSLGGKLLANEPTGTPMAEMTLRTYLRAAALCLHTLGLKPRSRYQVRKAKKGGYLTDTMELYLSWADKKDCGLCLLPEDDPDAFLMFTEEKKPWFRSKNGRPWDIFFDPNQFLVILRPVHEEGGWHLDFSFFGNSYRYAAQIVRCVLALHRAGFPLTMMDAKKIVPRFSEQDLIAFCPEWMERLMDGIGGSLARTDLAPRCAGDVLFLSDIEDAGVRRQVTEAVHWLPETRLSLSGKLE